MSAVVVAVVFVTAAGYAFYRWVARPYSEYRGARVVTCPETGKPVGVALDAKRAVLTALAGKRVFRLDDCTRWPERAGCGQECLAEIEAAPHDCLVRVRLGDWYGGKSCALCREPFGTIRWAEAKPGLLSPEGAALFWEDVPPEQLPETLATHRPVCCDCVVAERFRQRFGDLVTDRTRAGEGLSDPSRPAPTGR
jgi:hypothetical protein